MVMVEGLDWNLIASDQLGCTINPISMSSQKPARVSLPPLPFGPISCREEHYIDVAL